MSSSLATTEHATRVPVPSLARNPVEALLACVGGQQLDADAPILRSSAALYRLAELALHHRTASATFLGLQNVVAPEHPVFQRLQLEYVDGVARHLRTLADLAHLSAVLNDAGVPWLVIKGPVLAENLYQSADLRSYEDLDIVVPPARFADAIRAIEGLGFTVIDRNWSVILAQRRAQLHAVLRLGTTTDLHWHLLNRDVVRNAFDISTNDLFDRSRSIDLAGQSVLTLDVEDTLAHLCVHAGLDGGDQLRLLKDIERAVAAGVDWDVLIDRACVWRARLIIVTMLERAAAHLSAPVPSNVVRELHASAVTRIASRHLQRTWSAERITRASPSARALFTRGLRNDLTSSTVALLRKLASRRSIDDWTRSLSAKRTNGSAAAVGRGALGALYESGDDDSKAEYFEDVVRMSMSAWAPPGPVMFVCSTGGHLAQLYRLRPWWSEVERIWVTFHMADSRSLLADETVEWAHHPTTRNIPNLLRNTRLAWRLLRRNRPALVVSDGAGVALPFFALARLWRIPSVYVEVYDRIDIPSLTGRLCYRLSDAFVLQWDEQRKSYPRGTIIGRLL